MPRCARKLVDSGIYHIMIRGVNKNIIFKDDSDRTLFLRLLYYYRKKFGCKIHAYCLMDNHVHILFEDNQFLISNFMRDVTSHYAVEFNRKYKRVGHLYQERFKSERVYNDDYLLRLIRYIHRNPEKAGISKTEKYIWSSYKEYVYKKRIIDKNYILSKFNSNQSLAIELFKKFVLDKEQEELDKIYVLKKLSDEQAIKIIKYKTNIENIFEIKNYEKEERNKILQEILKIENLNNSQIARILKISKNFKNNI